jgi:hypothetical protein
MATLDSKIPEGRVADKWNNHKGKNQFSEHLQTNA